MMVAAEASSLSHLGLEEQPDLVSAAALVETL